MVNTKLAYLRCVRRGTKLGIVVFFIALLQATFVITNAVTPLVESQSVEQQFQELTKGEKWFSINLGDASKLGQADKNKFATNQLESLGGKEPFHFLAYRPISDNTEGRFQLVGTNRLPEQIVLTSGRLPNRCDENLCEVLLVNADLVPLDTTKFQIVGNANLKPDSPMLPSLDPTSPWLLSSSVDAIAKSQNFLGFPGTETWSTEITDSHIQNVGLTRFLEQANQTVNELTLATGRMQLIAPLAVLERSRAQTQVMLNRVLSLELSLCLVGSFGIFLLSRSGQKSHLEFCKSAKQFQPTNTSKFRITLSTAAFLAILGTLLGILAGWLGTSILIRSLLFHQINLIPIFIILLSSLLLIFSGLSNSRSHVTSSLFVVVLAWMSFIYASELQPQLALIAVLASTLGYLVVASIFRNPKNRFIKSSHLSNKSWIAAITMTGAFLISIIISGSTYLNSLEINAIDSAIYSSPTLTRIKMGGDAQVLQVNTLQDYERIADGAVAYPIRKIPTTFQASAVTASPVQLMGIDSTLWSSVPDISHQTGFDLRKAESVLPSITTDLGINVVGVTQIQVRASGLNKNTFLGTWVLNQQSESVLVKLEASKEFFTANLPPNVDRIIGFQITEDPDFGARREHAVGEGKNALPVPVGKINLDTLLLDRVPTVKPLKIEGDYSVINGPVYFSLVPPPPNISALVDPETSSRAKGNGVQLKITPDNSVELKVVGIADSLPTVPMQFAIVDAGQLTQLLASSNPDLLRIPEVWLTGNVNNSLDAAEKLLGLTVVSQKQLISKNLSPINATWTKRSFAMLEISALLMFVALLIFATRNIFLNAEMIGWQASGKKLSVLHGHLARYLALTISLAMVSSLVVTVAMLPIYIKNLTFDIKGDMAYPPVVTQWNWSTVTLFTLGLCLASLIILLIISKAIERISEARR